MVLVGVMSGIIELALSSGVGRVTCGVDGERKGEGDRGSTGLLKSWGQDAQNCLRQSSRTAGIYMAFNGISGETISFWRSILVR